jgi:hypothetical protein
MKGSGSMVVAAILLGFGCMLRGFWKLRTGEPDSCSGIYEFLCGVLAVLAGCLAPSSLRVFGSIPNVSENIWWEVVQVMRVGMLLGVLALCAASIAGVFSRQERRQRGTVSRVFDGLED